MQNIEPGSEGKQYSKKTEYLPSEEPSNVVREIRHTYVIKIFN